MFVVKNTRNGLCQTSKIPDKNKSEDVGKETGSLKPGNETYRKSGINMDRRCRFMTNRRMKMREICWENVGFFRGFSSLAFPAFFRILELFPVSQCLCKLLPDFYRLYRRARHMSFREKESRLDPRKKKKLGKFTC
jgi:hypothetical protein